MMVKGKVIFCMLVGVIISWCQAATLDTAVLTRYICHSRVDGFRTMVPGSCSQYYQCYEGKAQINTCPHYYDAVSQRCVNENRGCVETIMQAKICEGPCCGISDGGYAVDVNDPSIYYLCKNDCIAQKNTCTNGQMFDLIKLKCDSPSTCTECTTNKPPCESTTSSCTTTTTTTSTATPSTKTTSCTTTSTTTNRTTTTTSATTTSPCSATTPYTTTTSCTTTTSPTSTATSTPGTTTTPSTTTRSTSSTKTTRATTTLRTTTKATTCSSTATLTTATTPCTTPITKTTPTAPTTTTKPTSTTTTNCTTTTTTCSTTSTSSSSPCSTPTTQQTTTKSCTTTEDPCTYKNEPNNNTLADASHYILPTKMSNEEMEAYIRFACIDKPEGYMLPSLTKCNEYFICRNNIALKVSCGKKYFNIRTNTCELPSNTGCIQANTINLRNIINN